MLNKKDIIDAIEQLKPRIEYCQMEDNAYIAALEDVKALIGSIPICPQESDSCEDLEKEAEAYWKAQGGGSHAQWDKYKAIVKHFTEKQKEQKHMEVDLEKYISDKLRELGADLINHKPYSFNRGLNVGKTSAYNDILKKINARKV